MSEIKKDLKYTEEHEWVMKEGETMLIGITDHAQDSLGEIVYLELPSVGDELSKSTTFGAVESTKSVSDLYTPIDCEVVEVNSEAETSPELINNSPYKDGWLIKVRPSNQDDYDSLLSPDDYESLINEK
jgi:glycine cleavage system H protein|tara:strand:+ start:152 stop:538 length:387 start_codon:yes stop_codon:yes gene_type:complete